MGGSGKRMEWGGLEKEWKSEKRMHLWKKSEFRIFDGKRKINHPYKSLLVPLWPVTLQWLQCRLCTNAVVLFGHLFLALNTVLFLPFDLLHLPNQSLLVLQMLVISGGHFNSKHLQISPLS